MLGAMKRVGCKRLLAVLVLALMAFSTATPAFALGASNGIALNGTLNGIALNGSMNGTYNGMPTTGTANSGLNFMSLTVQAVHK